MSDTPNDQTWLQDKSSNYLFILFIYSFYIYHKQSHVAKKKKKKKKKRRFLKPKYFLLQLWRDG